MAEVSMSALRTNALPVCPLTIRAVAAVHPDRRRQQLVAHLAAGTATPQFFSLPIRARLHVFQLHFCAADIQIASDRKGWLPSAEMLWLCIIRFCIFVLHATRVALRTPLGFVINITLLDFKILFLLLSRPDSRSAAPGTSVMDILIIEFC